VTQLADGNAPNVGCLAWHGDAIGNINGFKISMISDLFTCSFAKNVVSLSTLLK
jgi:hypothetical protein